MDVFFVISGYLITSIILNEMDDGKFRLINFYERRARRILPALFFVMLVCTPFAWMFFERQDMKDYAQSLIAVSTFSSNILFWLESGYFDTATELKPLLHTWSLAVEEQYYILFPIFMMLTWSLGKRRIVTIFVVAFVLSLGFAHWGAYHEPSATFYLLPTRGWEILIGALVAFYLQKGGAANIAGSVNQLLSLAGLVLLFYAIFAFDKQTPFPSLYALVPTIGTAMIILFAVKGTYVNALLSYKAIVGVGLISYSAYLWHQPLFAFTKYVIDPAPSALVMLALCFATFPLAYLSWLYVEKPFRDRDRFTQTKVFQTCGMFACYFAAIGLFGHLRISTTEIPEEVYIAEEFYIERSSYEGPQKVVLLGDSHAGHLFFGLQTALGKRVGNYTSAGCIPFYNVDRYDSRFTPGECARRMNIILDKFAQDDELKTIILATMGPVYLDGVPFKSKDPARVQGLGVVLIDDDSVTDRWGVFEIGMRNTFERLTSLPDKKVIFVLDVPELGIEMRFCAPDDETLSSLGSDSAPGKPSTRRCSVSREEFDDRVERYHALVKRVASEFPSVILFDPTDLFCDEQECSAALEGQKLYRDSDHLSNIGSLYVARFLGPIVLSTLDEALAKNDND